MSLEQAQAGRERETEGDAEGHKKMTMQGVEIGGQTHTTFIQETGIRVTFDTKRHRSFPNPNHVFLCLNLIKVN